MPVFAVDAVQLTGVEKTKVNISKPKGKIKGSLLIKDDELLQSLIDAQQQQDMKDIEALWKGTVENNKVIEFSLKKLATPESQRRIHSSLMAKTGSSTGVSRFREPMLKVPVNLLCSLSTSMLNG